MLTHSLPLLLSCVSCMQEGVLGKVADARRRLTGTLQELFVKFTGGDRKDYS